jgi:ribosome-binding factor A
MRKDSVKNTRINSEVMKVLAEAIRGELKDPRIPPFTSVTDAVVAPDLKTCKVWVSFLCGEEEEKEALEGLKSAEGFLRRQLASELNLRITPELKFYADHSIAYGNHMAQVIDRVSEEDKKLKEKRGE